ncbi:MAG: prepilin-type N-terminal cleavage/methylation domain-containing protein [Candidatus Rokubacteria bacterium]|nr:prepilin-type N-terminal cleavage/methylation domain-containing protein [Candidatus Rokubacteria bacterium]MBI4594045.1 prepilin-type N-terminal cleavage/methylation domain-containing protein [Candidatus Rokubacteria bacterium]
MRRERGFTLAELLVALAMLATILAGIFALQRQGQDAYLMGAARVEAQQSARLALDLMTRELRSATSVTTVTGCNNGTDDITFADQDGSTVRYRKNGASLERTVGTTLTVLIAGVQSLTFTCYAADGTTTTATAANVRSVVVALRTQPEDVSTSTSYSPTRQQMIAESRVRLRNI